MKKIIVAIIAWLSSVSLAESQIISTVAGTSIPGFSGDGGTATNAQLNGPVEIKFDTYWNLYIADFYNDRIRVINTAGLISTMAGGGSCCGGCGYCGDGGSAIAAETGRPTDIETNSIGELYIVDRNSCVIRKVSSAGIINLYCGSINGCSFAGDSIHSSNALLKYPTRIIFDSNGNLYIVDTGNNRIRLIDSTGYIYTIAGNGISAFSGDGGLATSASISSPSDITFDINGNMYLLDSYNQRVRKINTSGIINTIAGTGTPGYSGDNGTALSADFFNPSGIAVDGIGNVFISDRDNQRIRKIDTSGIITTIVGTGTSGYSGDGGLAVNAEINSPYGLAFDSVGNLYIADFGNNVIRKVTNVGVMASVNGSAQKSKITVYPNPSSEKLFVYYPEECEIEIFSSLGGLVYRGSLVKNALEINANQFPSGLYFIRAKNRRGIRIEKIIVQH